ncbi:sodium-independent sulfate anion transporter isoform X2 [Microcaecilia unicolor]|uniref:Sodium-independent sulfate anion transporter isoform X2 n=1 Tax=Microcaecilia unicolor TaxID=1415580 RepID=A0A6P7YAG4_9AMPH|nr:sodium-independent sulfate anion transporter isoform X2 [Microcaecilia unicolor]
MSDGTTGWRPLRLWHCCSYQTLQKRLPVLQWLPRYSLHCLKLDVIAGFTIGLTVVPQGLAYADVAGLPDQYGLYSSFMGCFVYCLMGTSKDVTLGPTAIMSLLVSFYTFGDPAFAVLMTFLSGCIQLAMGLLCLGFLLDFISYPVIKGFTLAASVTIGFSQIKNLLGLHNIPQQFFLQVYQTFRRIGETRAGDATLGVLSIAALLVLKRMKSHIPRVHRGMPLWLRLCSLIVWVTATARNALLVIAAGLIAYSFQVMGSQPFILTGKTTEGLPPFRPPPFSKASVNGTVPFVRMVQDMGAGVGIIPFMGLLESIAIAKAFGITNILGSFVSSYPVTGSFGRTAVNAETGVCTPAGGLITGALVLLSLAYLTPLFFYIPKAALAAVIICAVAPMFDTKVFRTLWKVKKLDLVPFFATFLLCFWEVQYGILAGVIVSGILLLYPVARPQIKVYDHEDLVVKPLNGLSFPATEYIRDRVYEVALAVSPPRSVVLDCDHVSSIDYTVLAGLEDLQREFERKGVSLTFSDLQDPVLRVLLAAEFTGPHQFHNQEEARG